MRVHRRLFGRPVRSDRLDIIDGAVIGYCSLLGVTGIALGLAMLEMEHARATERLIVGGVIALLLLAGCFVSCSLSRKYIVDSDEIGREERNLIAHRILAGPVALLLIPLMLASAVYFLFRG
jgi:hypothetical protein